MRIQNKESFGVTVILLIFLLVFFWLALGYGAKEKLIPMGVLLPCILLAVMLLLGERFPGLVKKFDVNAYSLMKKDLQRPGKDKPAQEDSQMTKVLIICLWSAGFLALIFLLGFIIAIPIYLLLFFKIYGNLKWGKSFAVTLVTWGLVYVFFEILLKEELFRGILFEAFVPPI